MGLCNLGDEMCELVIVLEIQVLRRVRLSGLGFGGDNDFVARELGEAEAVGAAGGEGARRAAL